VLRCLSAGAAKLSAILMGWLFRLSGDGYDIFHGQENVESFQGWSVTIRGQDRVLKTVMVQSVRILFRRGDHGRHGSR
jgi:hypothetical protein